MPEGYTHVRTAHKAAEAIHYKIQCPAAFAAGANGPDSFFCYEVWKKRAKRHYDLPGLGNRMHEEKTGAFLRSLCANVKTRPQVEYALGFLSHYAADTVVHPFIYAMCKPGCPYAGKGGHGYLEIALDSTLHAEDTGSSLVPVEDVSPLPTGAELADVTALLHTCLLETYGEDIPVEYLADAFWHTYRLRGLFPSRHGVRRVLFWLIEPLFGGRGFITGHVSPRQLDARLGQILLQGLFRHFPDGAAGSQPVDLRHHDVQHDEPDVRIARQLDGLTAVAAGDDLIAVVLQVEANALDQQLFIIYDQYFHGSSSTVTSSRSFSSLPSPMPSTAMSSSTLRKGPCASR